MLNELRIRGFRKNQRLDIVFAMITVVRGPSGSGKSAMVGALKWILFNQPNNDNYINWDMDFAAVRLFFDDHKLTRKRTAAENFYKLDKQKYEAFGTAVPEDISRRLLVNQLNVHSQHAGSFWFGQTPGEVARQLNKIVNLDIIDKTYFNLSKSQRDIVAVNKNIKVRIKQAKETKTSLRHALQMDMELTKLERLEKQAKKYAQDVALLAELLSTHIVSLNQIKNAAERVSVAQISISKGKLCLDYQEKYQKLDNLLKCYNNYKKIQAIKIPDLEPVLKLRTEYEQARHRYESLTELFGRFEQYEEVIHTWKTKAEEKQKEFKKLLGKQCPLCKTKL